MVVPARIPAGEMRHVVIIKEHKIDLGTTAYDSYGMVSISSTAWVTAATVRAKIEELGAGESDISRQKFPTSSHMVTIDYSSTLASTGGPRRAVVFGSRFLHIGAILNPGNENRQLVLICGEEK